MPERNQMACVKRKPTMQNPINKDTDGLKCIWECVINWDTMNKMMTEKALKLWI